MEDHPLPDIGVLHLSELEAEGFDEVLLLRFGLALEEHPGLAVVIEEACAALAHFRAVDRLRKSDVAAGRGVGLRGKVVAEAVRAVTDLARADRLAHVAVALVVVHGGEWPVDRDLVEVGAAEPDQLRVRVREQPALQERVVA